MSWYGLARSLLFKMDGETSHEMALATLAYTERLGVLKYVNGSLPLSPVSVADIRFPNPVGLAAGLDKNGDCIDALGRLGFGAIEIGTVTPRPQAGNPKPRLFRSVADRAIINRMGFNNKGVDYLVGRVKRSRYNGVLGINIGKNFDTAVEKATDDYLTCLNKVYEHAHYITINISSPNTPGLRSLQFGDALNDLLLPIKDRQYQLAKEWGYKPIFVKIAPDMSPDEIELVASTFVAQEVDGVIATNTTLSRDGLSEASFAAEAGGMSGAPLQQTSTDVIRQLRQALSHTRSSGQVKHIPIIGVGGITDGESAAEKIDAGADLVQVYSGFVYRGPALIKEAVSAIEQRLNIRKLSH